MGYRLNFVRACYRSAIIKRACYCSHLNAALTIITHTDLTDLTDLLSHADIADIRRKVLTKTKKTLLFWLRLHL